MAQDKQNEIKAMLQDFKANGINHEPGKGLNKVLRFQDLIGTSNGQDLYDLTEDMDNNDRQILIWVSGCCLSFEGFMQVTKWGVMQRYSEKVHDKYEAEYGKRLDEETFKLTVDRQAAIQKAYNLDNEVSRLEALLRAKTDEADGNYNTAEYWAKRARDAETRLEALENELQYV